MAKTEKKESVHIALKSARIGSKKDGSAKTEIKKGQELKDLTEKQVESYRSLKIIK